jgi:hypothetical protein
MSSQWIVVSVQSLLLVSKQKTNYWL